MGCAARGSEPDHSISLSSCDTRRTPRALEQKKYRCCDFLAIDVHKLLGPFQVQGFKSCLVVASGTPPQSYMRLLQLLDYNPGCQCYKLTHMEPPATLELTLALGGRAQSMRRRRLSKASLEASARLSSKNDQPKSAVSSIIDIYFADELIEKCPATHDACRSSMRTHARQLGIGKTVRLCQSFAFGRYPEGPITQVICNSRTRVNIDSRLHAVVLRCYA